MKTATIELPDAVFNQLVKDAEQRQQPFATYVADLLARESCRSTSQSVSSAQEPSIPLIQSRQSGVVPVTNEMISELELKEDAERYGRSAGR